MRDVIALDLQKLLESGPDRTRSTLSLLRQIAKSGHVGLDANQFFERFQYIFFARAWQLSRGRPNAREFAWDLMTEAFLKLCECVKDKGIRFENRYQMVAYYGRICWSLFANAVKKESRRDRIAPTGPLLDELPGDLDEGPIVAEMIDELRDDDLKKYARMMFWGGLDLRDDDLARALNVPLATLMRWKKRVGEIWGAGRAVDREGPPADPQ